MLQQIESSRKINVRELLLLSFLILLPVVSLRMYTPCFAAIKETVSTSINQVQYSLVVFLFISAFFELGVKRHILRFKEKAMIGGLILFCIASLICAFATNIWFFNLGRMLQALGAAAAAVNYRVLITKLFESKLERIAVYSMTGFLMSLFIIPDTLISGFISDFIGWQAVFFLFVGLGLITILLYFSSKISASKIQEEQDKEKIISFRAFFNNANSIKYLLPAISQYSGFIIFIVTMPKVMIVHKGLTATEYGASLILLTSAYFIGSLVIYLLAKTIKINERSLMRVGVCLVSLVALVLCVFYFFGKLCFISALILMLVYQIATCFINDGCNVKLINPSTPVSSSAYVGFSKYACAALFGAIAIYFTNGINQTMFAILVACLVTVLGYNLRELRGLIKRGGKCTVKITKVK